MRDGALICSWERRGWVGGWVGCGWEGNGEQLSPPGLCFSDGTVSLEARGIQIRSSG